MYIYTLTLKAKTQWQCRQTVIICVIAGGRGSDVLLSLTARVETAAQCPELCESQWGKLTVTLWIHLYFSVSSGFTGLFCFAVPIQTLEKISHTFLSSKKLNKAAEGPPVIWTVSLSDLTVAPQPASLVSWSLLLVVLRERERETALFIHLYCMCVGAAFVLFSVCVSWISIASRRPRDPEGEEGSVQSWQRRPLKRRMERRLLAADKRSV